MTYTSIRIVRRAALPLLAGLVALLSAGCPGEIADRDRFLLDGGNDPGASCPSGTDVEADILATRCGGSICHSPGNNTAADLDLLSEGVGDRLVGVPSVLCDGETLVVSGSAEQSHFYEKLLPNPSCGDPMPLGQQLLTDAELACVRQWLEAL